MTIKIKLWAIMRLIRFEHSVIGGIGVLVGVIITTQLDNIPIDLGITLIGTLVVILLIAGCFALNDYFDIEVDRKNDRNDRPLVSGDLTNNEVLSIIVVSLLLGIILAATLERNLFIIASIWLIFGILYDYKLKELGLIGNIYVATTYGAPWFYGSLLYYSRNEKVLIAVGTLTLIAFMAGLGREFLKGIMDIEGDKLRNVKTIARVYGSKTAANLATIFIFGSIAITPLPFFYSFDYSYTYLVFVLITNIILIRTCLMLLKNQSYATARKARNHTLIAFIIGAIAFLGGVIGP